MSKWVAVLDRPYYPRVEEYETREEAEAAADQMAEEETPDGAKDAVVYVAEVVRRVEIKTDY